MWERYSRSVLPTGIYGNLVADNAESKGAFIWQSRFSAPTSDSHTLWFTGETGNPPTTGIWNAESPPWGRLPVGNRTDKSWLGQHQEADGLRFRFYVTKSRSRELYIGERIKLSLHCRYCEEDCLWILAVRLEGWASVSEEESVKEARGGESAEESEKAVAARARAPAMAVLAVAARDL